jgi:hypothetical protein
MTTDIPTPYQKPVPPALVPIVSDLSTIDVNKPVQKLTAQLVKFGSGMIE